MSAEDRRLEYETVKKEAQEKERRRLELQNKANQVKQVNIQQSHQEDPLKILLETATIDKSLKTFAESRGYLASAPGFNSNIDKYIEVEQKEDFKQRPKQQKQEKEEEEQVETSNTQHSIYRKVEGSDDGPRYVPSSGLPSQYLSNGNWKCHSCFTVQSAGKDVCDICGTLRSNKSISLDTGNQPQNDWICSSCKVSNNSDRTLCVMCGAKYKPPQPPPTPTKTKKSPKQTKSTTPSVGPKKKAIVTKAESGVELQYAKGLDNLAYVSGSSKKAATYGF
eukprot:TRINITY_DN12768_c0_g1_i1.p1 TRINITY_DN12768_c0_g1~~TRINITY_DN12768_c0_g1_i1.p1  ORF type:complete len:328 (-),score=73.52 TRINITY_DN12768_c0_g1_i1:66-902(-)